MPKDPAKKPTDAISVTHAMAPSWDSTAGIGWHIWASAHVTGPQEGRVGIIWLRSDLRAPSGPGSFVMTPEGAITLARQLLASAMEIKDRARRKGEQ